MIGQEIAAMRKRLGLSQNELAKQLNIKQNTMSQYEKGIRKVPFDILAKVSKIFNCSILDLASEELNYHVEISNTKECCRVASPCSEDSTKVDPLDSEIILLLKDLDQIAKNKVIDFMHDQKVITRYYKAIKKQW